MRYTVPIVIEKTLELLDVKPLSLQYGQDRDINGFSTYTRERRRPDILWINDNSSGQHPYASCGAMHCVYIASRAEEAGELPGCDAMRSLIVLPHAVQLRRLVTAMERCFAFYNAWSDELLDILRRGGDWDELLAAGHRVLRNPMLIFNRSMRVLACTASDGTEDQIWADTVREGTALVDTPRQSAELMRFLNRVEQHDAPFRHRGEGMSDPFWSAPVQVGRSRQGMVNVVEYHGPLSEGKQDLLRAFAEYAAIGMQRMDYGAPAPDAVPRQFMMDLISGEIASRERLNTQLIAMDWQAMGCFRFVSIRPELPFLSGEQWRSHYGQLTVLGLNGLCCIMDRKEPGIALLLTAPGPERFTRLLEVIEQFCGLNRLRAGVSDVYGELLETPRFYRQAEAALELVEGRLCHYERARYGRLLRHLRSHPFRQDLLHPAVARLAELDRTEGSEYIATLRTLIEHNYNQMETAEALGIHRTTLAYRLRRIQELTGLQFSSGGEMFHAAVSLKLMES